MGVLSRLMKSAYDHNGRRAKNRAASAVKRRRLKDAHVRRNRVKGVNQTTNLMS
jgi:hypothetical protein